MIIKGHFLTLKQGRRTTRNWPIISENSIFFFEGGGGAEERARGTQDVLLRMRK